MSNAPAWLQAYARATWQPPFEAHLPSDAEAYAARTSVWSMARRRARRELTLAWHGQSSRLRERIEPQHRRLLWIHQGTPQVGDSLMDLAARVLLQGRDGTTVDLLTDAHLLPLYAHDAVFGRVASRAEDLPGPYDLVLLHSAASRSVRDKLAHYRDLPFVHLQGCYTGPEFNRTLFGYFRLAQLLGWPTQQAASLRERACPSMSSGPAERRAVDQLGLPPRFQVWALGGVRDWRTCTRWAEVLQALQACEQQAGIAPLPVVLVGAANGESARDALLGACSAAQRGRFIDRIGRHSLGEVHALLQRASVALCADGGLLHVAHCARIPVVALFAAIIDPAFRLTPANRTTALHHPQQVDGIEPAEIARALLSQAALP